MIGAHVVPQNDDFADSFRCMACDEALEDGEDVYNDVGGEFIHAKCCGTDRNSFVRDIGTGEPLRDNEPIPASWKFNRKDF